jgi:hypothetical protein
MHTLRRYTTLMITAIVMVAAFATPALAGAEGEFVSKINASRVAAGLAPLEVYWDLTDDARAQSASMAAKGEIFHNPNLASVTGVWSALGENVGVGPDVSSLHAAFMASAGHRANILGDYNYIGVGVTVDENGLVWATMVFMRAEAGLNGGTTTTTGAPPTTTTTTQPPVSPSLPAEESTPTTTQPPVPVASANTESHEGGGSDNAVKASSPAPAVAAAEIGLVVAFGRPGGLRAIAD